MPLKKRLDAGLERYQQRRNKVHAKAAKILGNERLEQFLYDRRRSDLGAEPFGYDPFGFEPEAALAAMMAIYPIYKKWFRVESHGLEHIPPSGRGLIVSNHSGVLPLDAVMIAMDIVVNMEPSRAARAIIERFFADVPYVTVFMQRVGQVIGTRSNFKWLLEHEELVTVFPEGAKGTGKLFKDRYKMIPFNVGFMELSLLHRCPIIPTCVVGGEEQYPMLMNVKPIADMLGFPYFPVTAQFPFLGPLGLVPLPTKYRIYYGEPLRYYEDHGPETVQNPSAVRRLVADAQSVIEEMLQDALSQRESVWR